MGVNLLAFRRQGLVRRTSLREIVFQPGDYLLFRGPKDKLELLNKQPGFSFLSDCNAEGYKLDEKTRTQIIDLLAHPNQDTRLFALRVLKEEKKDEEI